MSLAGRNVLISGAHALGGSIAQSLAEAGARVILHRGAHHPDALRIDAGSVEVLTDPLDTVADAEALAAKCWESFGPLAGLVVLPETSPELFADSDDDWQAAMRSALEIPFFLTRAVASRMAQAGGGCIVNVIGATASGAPDVNEVTSAGSLTMALALAKALPANVRVCAVVGCGTDPTSHDALGIAHAVRFLLGEDSIGSGVVVRLDASRRAES
jgi:NAD(P)-dependent dehydrogenase (short-subunit alcohol dehydrogenase family)